MSDKPRFERSQKTQSSNKFSIVRGSGKLPDSRRNSTHSVNIGGIRNAIGQTAHPTTTEVKAADIRGPEWNRIEATPKNAGPAEINPSKTTSERPLFAPLQADGGALRGPEINTAMNHAIINGRDMTRPRLGASVIGGAAKNPAGVITGTDSHPKHP